MNLLGDYSHSDSETDVRGNYYNPMNFPGRYRKLRSLDENEREADDDKKSMIDEFGETQEEHVFNRLLRTSRQRKKLSARSKGGEFRQKRKKRRLYFCCISSEIDVTSLYDYLVTEEKILFGWKYQLTADVLHLFKSDKNEANNNATSDITSGNIPTIRLNINSMMNGNAVDFQSYTVADDRNNQLDTNWSNASRISHIGAQEVFIFDFGR